MVERDVKLWDFDGDGDLGDVTECCGDDIDVRFPPESLGFEL